MLAPASTAALHGRISCLVRLVSASRIAIQLHGARVCTRASCGLGVDAVDMRAWPRTVYRVWSNQLSDNVHCELERGERKRTFLIWYGAQSAPKRRARDRSGTFRTPRPRTRSRNVPNGASLPFLQA